MTNVYTAFQLPQEKDEKYIAFQPPQEKEEKKYPLKENYRFRCPICSFYQH